MFESRDLPIFPDLPEGQEWMINPMMKAGYRSEKNGVCFGIAGLEMLEFLDGDLISLHASFKNIADTPEEELINRMKETEKKVKDYVEDIVNQFKSAALHQLEEELKKNGELPESGSLNAFQLNEEQQNRINLSYRNELAKINLNALINDHVPEASQFLRARAIFEEVEIIYQVNRYPEFFIKGNRQITQDVMRSVSLLSNGRENTLARYPDTNEPDQEPITGMYSQDDLIVYFQGLRDQFKHLKNKVSLFLISSDHAITVGYDPKLNCFVIAEPNKLPAKYIRDEAELATMLRKGFSDNAVTTFYTEFYTKAEHKNEMNAAIQAWRNEPTFKKIHQPTSNKAKLRDSFGANWLTLAARAGDIKRVEALLAQGVNPNQVSQEQVTPLCWAVQCSHPSVVQALLTNEKHPNKKANPNKSDVNNTYFPLHMAIQSGRLDIIDMLLAHGANPNSISHINKKTPLEVAVNFEDLTMIDLLLTHGADPEMRNINGATALYIAVTSRQLDVVKALLQEGADPNTPHMRDNETPLLAAISMFEVGVIDLLLQDKRIDPNQPDKNGITPLHMAILLYSSRSEIVEMLLTAGASPYPAPNNQYGETSLLELAKRKGDDTVIHRIEEAVKNHEAKKLEMLRETILNLPEKSWLVDKSSDAADYLKKYMNQTESLSAIETALSNLKKLDNVINELREINKELNTPAIDEMIDQLYESYQNTCHPDGEKEAFNPLEENFSDLNSINIRVKALMKIYKNDDELKTLQAILPSAYQYYAMGTPYKVVMENFEMNAMEIAKRATGNRNLLKKWTNWETPEDKIKQVFHPSTPSVQAKLNMASFFSYTASNEKKYPPQGLFLFSQW